MKHKRTLSKIFFIGCFIILLATCFPIKDEAINTDLFKSKQELEAKISGLSLGMNKYNTFKKLNVPIKRFSLMNVEEMQETLYGNSQIQGTPEQLEKFKNTLLSYDGYYLPIRSIKKRGILGFTKINITKKGYDLRLLLIFENNKLIRASVNGSPNIDTDRDQYLWSTIIKRGTGVSF